MQWIERLNYSSSEAFEIFAWLEVQLVHACLKPFLYAVVSPSFRMWCLDTVRCGEVLAAEERQKEKDDKEELLALKSSTTRFGKALEDEPVDQDGSDI